jgi:hypothetical protein
MIYHRLSKVKDLRMRVIWLNNSWNIKLIYNITKKIRVHLENINDIMEAIKG